MQENGLMEKRFVKIFEFLVIFIPIFAKKSNFLRTNEVLPIEKANAMFHLPDHYSLCFSNLPCFL